jgi:hypothetical protein
MRVPAVSPQVAVLDVRLPDGDGVTVCRDLRSQLSDLGERKGGPPSPAPRRPATPAGRRAGDARPGALVARGGAGRRQRPRPADGAAPHQRGRRDPRRRTLRSGSSATTDGSRSSSPSASPTRSGRGSAARRAATHPRPRPAAAAPGQPGGQPGGVRLPPGTSADDHLPRRADPGPRRVFGNLYLIEKQGGGAFDEEDEAVVLASAAAAGGAIEHARLYERRAAERAGCGLTPTSAPACSPAPTPPGCSSSSPATRASCAAPTPASSPCRPAPTAWSSRWPTAGTPTRSAARCCRSPGRCAARCSPRARRGGCSAARRRRWPTRRRSTQRCSCPWAARARPGACSS